MPPINPILQGLYGPIPIKGRNASPGGIVRTHRQSDIQRIAHHAHSGRSPRTSGRGTESRHTQHGHRAHAQAQRQQMHSGTRDMLRGQIHATQPCATPNSKPSEHRHDGYQCRLGCCCQAEHTDSPHGGG